MVSQISHAAPANVTVEAAKPTAAKPQAPAVEANHTLSAQVKLSAAGHAAAKAAEEAAETPAQTTQEAARGDAQAIRLQARQSLAKTYQK